MQAAVVLAGGNALKQHIQQYAVHWQEEQQADHYLEAVIHQRDFNPVVSHKGVAALVERNKEERQGIADVTEEHGGGRSDPPGAALTQAIENVDVEDLTEHISHKAGDGDTGDKQIKAAQGGKALPFTLIGDGGDHVRDEQRRYHHRKNDASRQRSAENTHRQIGRQEDKRKGKSAPGGMKAENGHRQLHQIVTGGNDDNMEQR
ncbi:hypothetical protein D3C78_1359100 [compost metagenome]